MSNKKKKGGIFLVRPKTGRPGKLFVLPFFVVLFVLTVIAFIIPLRPTQSMNEKRNLAKFPEFSVEALASGDYFDDITTWFSDTFPGRDNWITLAVSMETYYGIQDVVIYGDISLQETVPLEYVPTEPEETETQTGPETQPTETEPQNVKPTIPEIVDVAPPDEPVEQWGGVNAGEDAEIYLGNVIQIGDTAFNYFRFSQNESNRFVNIMNKFAEAMADNEDVTIVTAMIPTSVGIMVESEYQEKIGCADQGQVIDYLYSGITDDIVKVNIFDTLVDHNNEYLYFRTDHHWTALAAYYCYRDICRALDMEAASLFDFEKLDMGTFRGSNYYKCNQSGKLELDNVYAYDPPGDITMMINNENGRFSWPVITDMSKSSVTSKYMAFLAGDHALCEITNNDLPDAPNCVIVKDSYGNCVAPFFTQNYHNVYVVDFREYFTMNMQDFAEKYDIDHVILLIQVAAAQDNTYNNLIRTICGVKG